MKGRTRQYLLFLIFVMLTVFYPLLFAEINSVDDQKMINSLINTNMPNIRGIFFPGGGGYYRPLISLTFLFDKYVWGLQESFMHLENVLLHTLNAVLVFVASLLLVRQFGDRSNNSWGEAAPLVTALLFGLHPVNTEAVNWISGRTDVLACFFLLVSFNCLLKTFESGWTLWLIPGAISFFLACLAKDPAVLFTPGAMLLIYVMSRKQSQHGEMSRPKEALRGYITYATVAFGYFMLRKVALSGGDTGLGDVGKGIAGNEQSLVLKLNLVLKAFGFYAKKLFVPWPLNFAIYKVSNIYIVVGVAAIICCIFLLYRRKLSGALILTGAFIIFPALLLPLGGLTWTPLAERYLYMPCAFFTLALTTVTIRPDFIRRHGRSMSMIVFIFLGGVGFFTLQRNLVWQHNLTLFQDTLQKSPDSTPIRNELALALQKAGRHDEAKQIFLVNGASDSGKYAMITALNRANAFMAVGKFDEARRILHENIDSGSSLYRDYLEMLVHISEKELDTLKNPATRKIKEGELIDVLKKLHAHTSDPFYYYRIGQRYLFAHERGEARVYFELAYRHSSENAYYRPAAMKLAEKLRQ